MEAQYKSCPVCGGWPAKTFEKRGHSIGECAACTHLFVASMSSPNHLDEVYNDTYFTGGGDGYPDYLGEDDLLVAHGRRYGRLLLRFMPAGRVLDIGAAAGFILKGLMEAGWSGDGIEPNASMAKVAQEKYGLNVQIGALEDAVVDEQYDVVTMIQVAAHFHDVRRAFEIAANATKPGGWWLIETSDKDSLPARMLGTNWHFISPPSVQNWFSRSTLTSLAGQFSMTPVAAGRPQKWLNGAHAKSLIGHKLQGPLGAGVKALLRLIPDDLPIPYPSLDLMWMLLRKAS